ncbi:carbohydrate ABC transporter substrate-binding protein (CUT1 family) [Motilibacter rhizosphaerae]|uniref:Carbohydrate ABC transporter substrate-binding protein (CUT1 family) n=1 Tax=Motilibacter rhizosphaerae TaxID=598652 RepID=A0A4Q7NXP1_9ACTN|nr:extracellular solute-binding protein [Motilibacter rhizosphaerae]RZS91162.1 carbohydrate ABC transporter substrate-binding protein (CUT1 family) [Motilibacter rhizosphaerae]
MKRTTRTCSALALVAVLTAACGSQGSVGSPTARGPITIWYSNNEQEIDWGKAMVAEWNSSHPNEHITAQEIPAGKSSEEVIHAAIIAGNTPCLVLNTAPSAVAQFQREGGLVPLDDFPDGVQYATARTGATVQQYKSADGKLYQLPWKTNPVMLFYNKKVFAKAGLDPDHPQLQTYAQVLAAARTLKQKGGVKAAIWPAPSNEYFQSWFDFYPLFAAATGGQQLLKGDTPQFDSPQGLAVAQFYRTLYDEGLAPRETYNGDSFAEGKAAMSFAGPWAVAAYKGKVDWGAVPVPTPTGEPADQVHTFSDAKNIAIYSACKNQATAWDVAKFATSPEQDGKLLQMTGQMPLRQGLTSAYASYFEKNPAYKDFASAASRTVEVPNTLNSTAVWQAFRDEWGRGVIFGKESPQQDLSKAARKISTTVTKS